MGGTYCKLFILLQLITRELIMKISRFFKTILMLDFFGGLIIALKEIFKSKKTINYPFEKR